MEYNEDYQKFRTKFLIKISHIGLSDEQLEKTIDCLDETASTFTFHNNQKKLSYNPTNGELPEIVNVYLTAKRLEGKSVVTLKNYLVKLRIFFRYVEKEANAISIDDIRSFFDYLMNERNLQLSSMDSYRSTIVSFFTWLTKEEFLKKNPTEKLAPIKFDKKMIDPFTLNELELIRGKAKTLRDLAMIDFMYSTGCRVSELANVKKSDVDWERKRVILFGKGRKERHAFLNKKCLENLLLYLDSRTDDNEYLFVSLRKPYRPVTKASVEMVLERIANQLPELKNKKRISPHTIRHTTATIALENGMPIEDISKLLGHANLQTTMIYATISDKHLEDSFTKYMDSDENTGE